MKKLLVIATLLFFTGQVAAQNKKSKTQKMDKTEQYTFQLNDSVTREKVSFKNRYGISISADLYQPKNLDKTKKYATLT